MGWLVGLPLGIFRMLFHILLLAVRFAVPLAVVFLVWRLTKRYRASRNGAPSGEPDFDGPVYEVDYKIVEDEKEE